MNRRRSQNRFLLYNGNDLQSFIQSLLSGLLILTQSVISFCRSSRMVLRRRAVLLHVYVCCFLVSFIPRCDSQSCQEGTQTVISFVAYRCQGGRQVPIACVLDNGQHLPIDGVTTQGGYEMKCLRGAGSNLSLRPVACLKNGRRMNPGETLTTPNFWYTCIGGANSLSLEVSGCVDKNGNRVSVGSTFTKGPFLFRCVKSGNLVTSEGYACVSDGQQIPIGGTFVRGQFWYQCSRIGEKGIQTELRGCAVDGRQLNDGEKYSKNGFLFQCKVVRRNCENCDSLASVQHTIVGCTSTDAAGNSMEYPIGARWVEQGTQPQFKFVIECLRKGNEIQKQVVQCSFESSHGRALLDPGCARKVGPSLIACNRRFDGVVEVQLLTSTDATADARAVSNLGLRFC
ncbi:hypothetical protein M514_05417 [Trichuris suis]|uniref:Abnormal cell migration protein 18-like fibronectin type I domain-containing protein n=1 Tax=Trichuris suis TaxID=68888 RepID=A0A085M916_9BILA|nr:hypothetical protein M513_05417 [Trichuris suis]KFD72426.1 hypothetical protein M514_05417 [Trichuris suis]